ncbi:MAG: ubiquinone biosynthesis protein, partial [Gaiellales bacterium]|nr:ubiquinone biosynthesis protein [Gaiellales bacterium]
TVGAVPLPFWRRGVSSAADGVMTRDVGARFERARRAVTVTRVAQRSGLRRVLAEIGVRGHREATHESARNFRLALEELGTTFIKLGQLLSSRPDLLPDVYIEELSTLVDEVPPVPFADIDAVIRADLGDDVFTSIDPEPLATASIAQAHLALLKTGRQVVVKVRRPGIVEQVELDLALLRSTAALIAGHSETAQLLQIEALTDELEVHLRAELDFLEEAHNTELIARLVEDYELLVVPDVIRPYVTEQVLTLEYIEGRKPLADHGLAPEVAEELARQFFNAYVHQVVVEGVFHADPHSGNVLLTDDGRLALLDFGLLGRLDDDTRRGLSLLLLAIAQNRADDVSDLIISLSLTTVKSDQPAFVQDVRRKLPRFHWRPLSRIHAGESLADLQRIALEHSIALPTSFALVGKTLAQADSIARVLYPELDPIALMEDEALEVMMIEAERRLEPNRLFAYLYTQLDPLTRMPRRLGHVLNELEQGSLKVGVVPTGLEELGANLRSLANRMGAAIIIGSLLLASALLARVHRFEWMAFAGFCVAVVLALYMVWKIIRTPGEL